LWFGLNDSLIYYRDISQRLRNITTECRNDKSSERPKVS
jgi:hypothetical protein